MESTEFVINRLKNWVEKWPTLHLQFAYDNRLQQHIVQVERGEVYKSKEFQDAVISLWNDFGKEYKGEELIVTPPSDFRADGSQEELSNILFEYGKKNFN